MQSASNIIGTSLIGETVRVRQFPDNPSWGRLAKISGKIGVIRNVYVLSGYPRYTVEVNVDGESQLFECGSESFTLGS